MCLFNGVRVTRAEYIRLMALKRQIEGMQDLMRECQNGFDYDDALILKATPDRMNFELVKSHWELVPDFVNTWADLKAFREGKKDPYTGKLLISKTTGQPLH